MQIHVIAAAAGQQDPLVPTWTELIIGIIAFLIVFGFLGRLLLPRAQKMLAERTNQIEGGLARAEEAQAKADRVLENYKQQLAEARHEAARLREEAREQGAQIIAEMREEAQAEARRLTEAANRQALIALRSEVGTLATDLASRVVGESLTDEARQSRVVDRFLDDLEQPGGIGARANR
jgi:F-type H+-transporting ATPase subunit b